MLGDNGAAGRVVTPNINSPDCPSVVHIIDAFLLPNEVAWDLGLTVEDVPESVLEGGRRR